ncbi:MAG: dipeptide epimerase [Gemmataceae bacterium]
MRIVELTAFKVLIPLRKPIKHASHERTSTENVVVRCVLEDGTEGYGEGVPREYVTGETADSALSHLKRSDISAQLEECLSFEQAVGLAQRIQLSPVEGDDRNCQGNAARCALEIAVLDAYGIHFGVSLSKATEIVSPEIYAPRTDIQYSGAITGTKGMKLRFAGWKYRIFGFHQMKVKVGIAGMDDPNRLAILRKRLGRKVDLRVDANEAWSPEEAVGKIRELIPFEITSVEQPVRHEHVAELAEVRKAVHVPIMHDESLCSMVDARRSVEQQTCDLFNIRLSKCGGFLPSLELAKFAKQHGLGYQLGCQVGETAILSAAGRHFACSVADIRYLEGSYDKHLVQEALGQQDITFGWAGKAKALHGPGLGIMVDPEALERVTNRKEPIFG